MIGRMYYRMNSVYMREKNRRIKLEQEFESRSTLLGGETPIKIIFTSRLRPLRSHSFLTCTPPR